MFSGGVVTIFVSDMDRSVRFYAEVLGLKLAARYGNEWASIEAGKGLSIGLHPASERTPAGRKGSISIGLELSSGIEKAVAELTKRGVKFTGPIRDDETLKIANFEDPDGNDLYLAELKHNYQEYPSGAST